MMPKTAGPHGPAHAAALPVALSLLLLCVALSYWPGLTGSFLLDDATNIAPLGDNGGIHSLADFKRYVLGGHAGPLGRPLSLASFVADAQTWPSDPWPFKLTNLLIHLLNTVLVFVLARQLLTLAKSRRPHIGALLCAALWGLHPLHVSTVLYVVQRMTELAATFTLLGLILFVHGRVVAHTRPALGYFWMSAGIGFCGSLAVLSKESGAQLPILALCVELLILRAVVAPPLWKPVAALMLWAPIVVMAAYFAWHWPDFLKGYAWRGFSLSERLFTEGPVLVDYLRHLVAPLQANASLFHDDFPLSRNWLSPASTLGSWLLIAGLLVIAIAARKRQPVLAFGLLWYFCAHLIESTFLPLEIYFEHRNYLPAFGLALIAGHYALQTAGLQRVLAVAGLTVFIGLETLSTHQNAIVWGNESLAVQRWTADRPGSLRAQQFAMRYWLARENIGAASAHIETFAQQSPQYATAHLQAIELRCISGRAVDAYARDALPALKDGKFDLGGPDSLNHIQRLSATGKCPDLQPATLMAMIDTYAQNPRLSVLPSQQGYLHFIKASELAARGHYALAVQRVADAARLQPGIFASYWQTLWMLQAGDLQQARRYLAEILTAHYGQYGKDAPLDPEIQNLMKQVGR